MGDVEALLDRVGEPVHLVGHDWGSAVAWLVAGSHPGVRTLTSLSVPHPAAYLRARVTVCEQTRPVNDPGADGAWAC